MQKTIITLTMNPAIDVSTSVGQVVAERKLRCKAPAYEPGGGGINVARAVKRLGGESTAVYVAGGPTGQMFQQLLNDEGLDQTPLSIAGATRESFTALDESSSQQYRFNMPGPALREEEWRRCLEVLETWSRKPEYLVASGSLPPKVPTDFYARVAATAKKLGARMVVDTSGDALTQAAQAGVYLLKPNMNELQTLAGEEIEDETRIEQVARDIVQTGRCEALVVSLGAAGAILATKERFERFRAPTVAIKSKVGAGDSMVAGLVLSLARGKSLREAMLFGVSAGAAAVTTPGSELCRREDTERLYEHLLTQYLPDTESKG